jgi:hypothetical protein
VLLLTAHRSLLVAHKIASLGCGAIFWMRNNLWTRLVVTWDF